MRALSIATAIVLCGLGCSLYAVGALNTASIVSQKTETSAEVKANIQKISSSDARERTEAACALGKARAVAAIPALINLLGDDTQVAQPVCHQRGNWSNKGENKTTPGEMAAVALSQIGHEAVEPLIGALKSSAWQARANAAFALGLIHDDRGIEPLISATRDSEPRVRAKASWSLGLVGDHRAVEPLSMALKDADPNVRSQAAWALGLKGDERSVEPLILALRDENEDVQSQSAWALGLKGDERAVEPLTIALASSADEVRSQAAWALGLKGNSNAVEALIQALKDPNANVRSQASSLGSGIERG
jgi:HEAT repeat protein